MPKPLAPRHALRWSLRTLGRSSRIWLGLPLLIVTACGGSTIADSKWEWGSTGFPDRILPPPAWYTEWASEQAKLQPDRNQMAVARAARLIWEAHSGRSVDALRADYEEATFAQVGRLAIDALGYEEVMRRAEQVGWVKRVRMAQAPSPASKQFLADGPPLPDVGAIIKEATKLVMTKTAPVALGVSQLDTLAPGPADLVAVGIFAVSLVAVGGVSVYIFINNKDSPVDTTSVAAPTAQPQPPPSPPPPPPPPPRETCEANSELNKIIRCDDPRISHYKDESENKAFKDIVKQKGQGLKKSNRDPAWKGPCKDRGGFHINVLRRGDSVASIYGCDCCEDASGKAVKRQRTETVKKY